MLEVKDPLANARRVRDSGLIPGLGDPLEEKIATHSSIPVWETPWTEKPGRLQSMGLQRVRHNWRTSFKLNMSIELVMLSNHFILCYPFLLLPSISPSIKVFSNELALHIWWPKYWSFSFSTSASSEYSRLISFRNDGFDLLAVQGSLKIPLHHHRLKA